MVENAILTTQDKEILSDRIRSGDIQEADQRIYKIRWRVRKRSRSLIQEIELLKQAGEEEIATEFLEELANNVDGLQEGSLIDRINRLDKDINELENRCANVSRLRGRLKEIEDEIEA